MRVRCTLDWTSVALLDSGHVCHDLCLSDLSVYRHTSVGAQTDHVEIFHDVCIQGASSWDQLWVRGFRFVARLPSQCVGCVSLLGCG